MNYSSAATSISSISISLYALIATPLRPYTHPSANIITRHWRYISAFHGPWLTLPIEVLQTIADNNYHFPRPRPVDPAVMYNMLNIRRLVDEASALSVKAGNDTIAAPGATPLSDHDLYYGRSAPVERVHKLSKERRYRMREQATLKLSKAYHLDEIACAVATMQASSIIDDVADHVRVRKPNDTNAKYVHYFHEKIPSRQVADHTPLEPLNEIIADTHNSPEPYRTRALTRILKEDFQGAIQDLTLALQICRYNQSRHESGKQEIQWASACDNKRFREDNRIAEEDQPSSLEPQLLFHRAGAYLAVATAHVEAALEKPDSPTTTSTSVPMNDCTDASPILDSPVQEINETPAHREAQRKRLEARKTVKTNAKRALRDYLAFLSFLDYTPGVLSDQGDEAITLTQRFPSLTCSSTEDDVPQLVHSDSASPASMDYEPDDTNTPPSTLR